MLIGGISAEELAERFGTPLFVTDEFALRLNYRRISQAFSQHMPIRVHYACKANTNLAVLRVLEQEGSCIDAVSIGEVDTCLRVGFTPDRILYTGVNVSDEELEAVVDRGVMINIDSFHELRRLAAISTGDKVSFRVTPNVGSGHHDKVVTGKKASKFGIPLEEIMDAYREAVNLDLVPVGVHAHIGSGGQSVEPFIEVTEVLIGVANRVEEELGITLEFIDIGGGIGIPYHPDEQEMDVEQLGAILTRMVLEDSNVGTFALEPGRYIVADTTVLLSRVVDIKETGGKAYIGVDAGFNNLIRPAMYDSYHHVVIVNRYGAEPEAEYDVAGPVCESGDILAKGRMLPEAQNGDLIAVLDAGAYGSTMSSQYNSRPRCAEVLVIDGQADLIRERETLEDVLRNQRVPERLMQ